MKRSNLFFLTVLLALCAAATMACAVTPAAQPSSATVATVAATVAATDVPTLESPTVTTTPLPITPDADADQTVTDALQNLASADTFRLQASTELSPVFFQPEYTPTPGDDPDKVNLFTIFGEQSDGNLNYTLTGFLASFIGLFTGFNPDSDELTIVQVDGKRYMRGVLEGETEAKWYAVPEEQSSNSSFTPQDMLSPMIGADYPAGSFARVGDATFHGMACSVYEGNRDAFDTIFPVVAEASLLNLENVSLDTIDTTEYQVTVCPDGNVYQVSYKFEGHSAQDPDEKGSFAFGAQLTDYEFDINIEAPEDAIPLPAGPFTAPATPVTGVPDGTTTPAVTQEFNTLEGEWEGTSGDDNAFSFTVSDGAITFASISYAISDGGCSTSGTIGNSVEDASIEDQQFTFTLTDSDNVEYIVTGEFQDNNTASGTLNIKGETFCGDTDATESWTASHISSPDAPSATEESTPTATDEPTLAPTAQSTSTRTRTPTTRPTSAPTRTSTSAPTRTPTTAPTAVPTLVPTTAGPSGAEIVAAALGAFSRRDLNGALAYFDDNVSYNLAGTAGVGKASLQNMLNLGMMFGTNFAVSNISQTGETVNFTVVVTGMGAGTYPNSTAVIRNGKVVEMNIR